MFNQAVNNVKPTVEVKSRRVGGANYQVPVEVRPVRRVALAMRWLRDSARGRGEKSMGARLAGEIAEAVQEAVSPLGVGVVIEASHLCMMMRGVEKQNSMTITSALLGTFRKDAKTRDEFLRLAHAGGSARA